MSLSFLFQSPPVVRGGKFLGQITGTKYPWSKRNRSEARRLKAHCGREKGKIRSAGRSPARKAGRRPPAGAAWKLRRLNPPGSPAKSRSKRRGQEAKAGSGCRQVREPPARVANQAMILPRSRASRRHAGSRRGFVRRTPTAFARAGTVFPPARSCR